MYMERSMKRLAFLSIISLGLALSGPVEAQTRNKAARISRAVPRGMPKNFQMHTVKVNGRQYYRTFRVTSKSGFSRIADPKNSFRFFQGDGQYGEAFYLFRSRSAARKYIKAEASHGRQKRNVLAEVLLPKEKFDAVSKKEVPRGLDWGMQQARDSKKYSGLRDLRLSSHLVFGKWAPSPYTGEAFYDKMNGARQLAVVQRGMPSILNEAIIRLHQPR